jgi:hypothetical protein
MLPPARSNQQDAQSNGPSVCSPGTHF